MIRDALTVSGFLALCLAGPAVLVIVGRWLMRRSEDNTFAERFIPDCADVVAAELEVALLVAISGVDGARLLLNAEFDRILGRSA